MNKQKKAYLSLVFLLFFSKAAQAGCNIPDEKAIHCILGEARLEYVKYGYNALLAHAEAIRHRNTLSGVYGCRVNYSDEVNYMKKKGAIVAAQKAWEESKSTNITNGADSWGSKTVDKKWLDTMQKAGYTKTYEIGDTEFYRKPKMNWEKLTAKDKLVKK